MRLDNNGRAQRGQQLAGSDNNSWAYGGQQVAELGNNEMFQISLLKVVLLSSLKIEI